MAPVLLGRGRRLFAHLGEPLPALEQAQVRVPPLATHIRYRVTAPPAPPTGRIGA